MVRVRHARFQPGVEAGGPGLQLGAEATVAQHGHGRRGHAVQVEDGRGEKKAPVVSRLALALRTPPHVRGARVAAPQGADECGGVVEMLRQTTTPVPRFHDLVPNAAFQPLVGGAKEQEIAWRRHDEVVRVWLSQRGARHQRARSGGHQQSARARIPRRLH
ncbi:MAG: hypothetical protein CMM37_00180 [Rhodospirillaceae bacterium]|nr:hypothetical protein [Rhodospirillaceae bacterium]